MYDFHSPSKNAPTSISSRAPLDPAGKARTASPGTLTFGSPNFKMLPEPLVTPAYLVGRGLAISEPTPLSALQASYQ